MLRCQFGCPNLVAQRDTASTKVTAARLAGLRASVVVTSIHTSPGADAAARPAKRLVKGLQQLRPPTAKLILELLLQVIRFVDVGPAPAQLGPVGVGVVPRDELQIAEVKAAVGGLAPLGAPVAGTAAFRRGGVALSLVPVGHFPVLGLMLRAAVHGRVRVLQLLAARAGEQLCRRGTRHQVRITFAAGREGAHAEVVLL